MTSNVANGWLRNPTFDGFFIFGLSAIAIATGLLVAWNEELFVPVLVADLWILGYHHVISTYTRLVFDSDSFHQHKHLVFGLFPAVAIAVTLLVMTAGIWLIPTIYLYWQWWHYTRQSEGISKAYAGKNRDKNVGDYWINRVTFYAIPIAGIVTVSWRDPSSFLFVELRTFPVPDFIEYAVLTAAVVSLILWTAQQVRISRSGQLCKPYVFYVCSHFAIYSFAYIFIDQINYGWLVINIWHNAQYILFVWLFNNRRFAGKPDSNHVFLSTISQNGRFWLYILTCLTISTAVYYFMESIVADAVMTVMAGTATMAALVIYQTINFHHYLVDSMIWKLRKKPIKKTLGMA